MFWYIFYCMFVQQNKVSIWKIVDFVVIVKKISFVWLYLWDWIFDYGIFIQYFKNFMKILIGLEGRLFWKGK